MLTTTSEYAIRALIYIAQQDDERPVLAREIASNTGVPGNYISKILRDLAHSGILKSTRGVGGGFRLARPAKKVCLADVVAPFENSNHRDHCVLGDPNCSTAKPCEAFKFYQPVKKAYDKFLDSTTLFAVANTNSKSPRRKTAKASRPAKASKSRKKR